MKSTGVPWLDPSFMASRAVLIQLVSWARLGACPAFQTACFNNLDDAEPAMANPSHKNQGIKDSGAMWMSSRLWRDR